MRASDPRLISLVPKRFGRLVAGVRVSAAASRLWLGLTLGGLLPAVLPGQSVAPSDLPTIRRLGDYWLLPNGVRSRPLPVEIEVQVLYNDPGWSVVQVRDENLYEYIEIDPEFGGREGEWVRIRGTTRGNPRTWGIDLESWELIRREPAVAVPVELNAIDHGAFVDRLISFEGLVETQTLEDAVHLTLQMVADGRRIVVYTLLEEDEPVPQLEGSRVKIRGVHAPKISISGEVTRLELWCAGTHNVEWLGPWETAPEFDRPVQLIDELRQGEFNSANRVRLQGTFLKEAPTGGMIVRDASGQALIKTAQTRRPEAGQAVDIVGRREATGMAVTLQEAMWRSLPDDSVASVARGPDQVFRVAGSIIEMPPQLAADSHRVDLTALVTWSHPDDARFFVQDSSAGIAVVRGTNVADVPAVGQLVRIEGVTQAGAFAPFVEARGWTLVGELPLPSPRVITRDQAMTGLEEAQRVRLTGFVFEASPGPPGSQWLGLSTATGEVRARIGGAVEVSPWLGSVVAVTGVCVARIDDNRRLEDIEIWVADATEIEVLDEWKAEPFDQPAMRLADLGRFNPSAALRHRVKVEGTVVWSDRPGVFTIYDEGEILTVFSRQSGLAQRGAGVEVVGFLGREDDRMIFREGSWRNLGQRPIPPFAPLADDRDFTELPEGAMVAVQGEVVDTAILPGRMRVRLQRGNTRLTAEILDAPGQSLAPLLPLGGGVELRGLVLRREMGWGNTAEHRLMVAEPLDVTLLQPPPWWSRERIMLGGFLLASFVTVALIWVWVLRRVVAAQTREIAAQTRRSDALREELQRAQRMESLGSMADGITRDFADLLDRIYRQTGEVLDAERLAFKSRHQLDQARAAILRAQDLTRKLSGFSLTGRSELAPVQLADFVREEMELFEVSPSIKLAWQLPPSVPLIPADRSQLREVFRAIMLNAVQAMPDGGTLQIGLQKQTFTLENCPSLLAPGRYVRLTVRDSGTGIQPEDIPRVFDPYFTRKTGSKGLGLAVAYAVVKQHRGRIEIESTPFHGTTVSCWLPVDSAAATRVDSPPSSI